MLGAMPVLAQGGDTGDKVVVGQSFTLESGDSLRGDLAVVGGNVEIEEDATLAGDMAVFGGAVAVSGRVTGNIVAFGGSVELTESAEVVGDVVVLGGSLSRAAGATVGGEIVEGRGPSELFGGPSVPQVVPPLTPSPPGRFVFDMMMRTLGAIGLSLVLATLGVLAVVLLPKQTERVAQVLVKQPAMALAAGILTWLIVVGLVVILAITICLAPLALLLFALAVGAWLFGWIATGWLVGQRLLQAFMRKHTNPLIETIVGVVIITLLWQVIPCMGWVFWFVVSSLGLGAVVLTLFGRQPSGSQPAPNNVALLPTVSTPPPRPPAPAAPPLPWYEDMPATLAEDLAADTEAPPAEDTPAG